ncbi:hypothetical protein LDENG_00053290 [Lucifuga dentata]|nr:hypothetical protein LDENG_00053290 [Lucifuga dentata]
MTTSDTVCTRSCSVAMATDSMGRDPDLDLGALWIRLKLLEQNAGPSSQSNSYLRHRIRELERSERSLMLQLYQLSATHLPSMQHSQRLDQRLHMLQEEVRTMTQEKERGERLWRERLQRCQNQLKAKEEEMSRQSQYFENFKTQLQQKLTVARDREQILQNRVYTLEKQLLDVTVAAATKMTTISAVRITAGSIPLLPSLRGEGEGEEEGEKREERRKQWHRNPGHQREAGRECDEGKIEKEMEGGRDKDTNQSSNEARLQGFILSLQEDLRVLLEREENGMAEQRGLLEQLQETQENSHFLGCKVEEMKVEVHQLKLSERSLMEEVEELREENQRLQQSLREAAAAIPESTCLSPETNSPGPSPAAGFLKALTKNMGHSSAGTSGKVHLNSDETHSAAISLVRHQSTAASQQKNTEDRSSSAKSEILPSSKNDLLYLSAHVTSKPNPSLQSPSLTTETVEVGEFNLGTWCSRGILNLEESPSEESDALREAYRSLGFGTEELDILQDQQERLEAALQHSQEQLQRLVEENANLKLQLRKHAEQQEAEMEQESSREKITSLLTQSAPSPCDGVDHLESSLTKDTILALSQDDLVQALNQENRALADRIQELLTHIELREEEIQREQMQLREQVSKLEVDRVGLEQENQEQSCLITELTKKTEDDLNTIMELQQRLEESRQHAEESQSYHLLPNKEMLGCQLQSKNTAVILCTESFQQNNLEECMESLVDSVLQAEEPQSGSSQATECLTASEFGSQAKDRYHSLRDGPQANLHVNSLTAQVQELNKSLQSLKQEQEELTGSINSLREQEREVALSVQMQTEEKQQLTRTVWGQKEEKDNIIRSLASLKQEREQLTRTNCGLKDEREQFIRSMSSLKEEKEQLTKSLSCLKAEKEKLFKSLLGEKEERDKIMKSLQSLQEDSEQLSQVVLNLKQERDELTDSLTCLKEQRDQEQSYSTLEEAHNNLKKSICSLKEEKDRTEHSITCLKLEEKHLMLLLESLREERDNLQAAIIPDQSQLEKRNQKLELSNQNHASMTKKTEEVDGGGQHATPGNHTNTYKGKTLQEQSDLMREIEALGAELKRSQEELDKAHLETKRLYCELNESKTRREEAERKATQAANKVMRMTDVVSQMEETRKENDHLTTQVKELQSRLTGLAKEKADALSLKAQIEEQHNILTAQLKAKTVALGELNSEYIAMKKGQGSKDELSATLMSLRTRYNDIRAKYDALLKKKSQADLDLAPLKAKLSCLVVKCQERNSLLAHIMKAMQRQGCVDPTLTQQVEQLLSDAALQDYTATFTPGSTLKTHNCSNGITSGIICKFQDYTNGFTSDQSCSVMLIPGKQQQKNRSTPECGGKSENHTCVATNKPTTNAEACRGDVTLSPTGTLKKNASSSVAMSSVQESASVQVVPLPADSALKESLSNVMVLSSTSQLTPSNSGPIQVTSCPEKLGLSNPEMKRGSSPGPASFQGRRSSQSPTLPPSSGTCVSRSKRLSSPEKIINLHEQLQKTLLSSYQAPVSRGRGQQPRKSLSSSVSAENLTVNNLNPVTTNLTPAVTTKPSTTLFTAVTSRSANITFSSSKFTHPLLKANVCTTATSSTSGIPTATPGKAKSTSSSVTEMDATPSSSISPRLTRQSTAIPVVSDSTKPTTPTLRTTASMNTTTTPAATVPKVLMCSETTASDTPAPNISTAPKSNSFKMISKMEGAAPGYDSLVSAVSCTESSPRSPERSLKSARKSTATPQKATTPRPKPDAPAEVGSVEVIKTVGQSSLMIGWKRPPLDELGCSNGTFVYGYRVFVDGEFHKSVMSSACTKCILENLGLSVPVHISVQTLGSNGLSSNSVHAVYRASVRTEDRPSSHTDSQPLCPGYNKHRNDLDQ